MADLSPNIQFDQGPAPKPSYFKLAILAGLGVLSAILFFSMMGKPKFFARLMGADVNEYIASSDELTQVSADSSTSDLDSQINESSGLPRPTQMTSIYPTTPSKPISPTITQVPTTLTILRTLYKDGRLELTGPAGEIVSWECGDLVGNSISGKASIDVQKPLRISLQGTVSVYDCIYNTIAPSPPVGYKWLKPFMSVNNKSGDRSLTLVDRLVSINKPTSSVSIQKSPTPVVTKVSGPSVSKSPTNPPSLSKTPTPKLSGTVSATSAPVKTATPYISP